MSKKIWVLGKYEKENTEIVLDKIVFVGTMEKVNELLELSNNLDKEFNYIIIDHYSVMNLDDYAQFLDEDIKEDDE